MKPILLFLCGLSYELSLCSVPLIDNTSDAFAKYLKTGGKSALNDAIKKKARQLTAGLSSPRAKANAIFDIDTYSEVYWKDLEESVSEVVISSPRLNNAKVSRLIDVLKNRQVAGLKATIVTWHPDHYLYGKTDVRMELMERLRQAGFTIELVENTCEHFAVIDNEIVWYGSVNLLSKEDADDNLMRIESKKIAAELRQNS